MAEPMTDARVADLADRATALTKAINAEFAKEQEAPYAHSTGYYLSCAGPIAQGALDLIAEVERLRTELQLAFSPGMYLDIQQVLDKALGTNEADGAGAGIVADVALLAEQRDKARSELAQVLTNYEHVQGRALVMEGERDDARAEAKRFRQEAETQGRLRRAERRDVEAQRGRADGAERARDQILAVNGVLVQQAETAEAELAEEKQSARSLRTEVEKLRAERARVDSALSDEGRAVADSTGDLEDGINFDLLAKNAEIAALVDAVTAARGERDEARAELDKAELDFKAISKQRNRAESDRDEARRQVDFLTEVMTGTVLIGSDDALAMLRALTEHLATEKLLDPVQIELTNAGLDKQQADRDNLTKMERRLEGFVTGLKARETELARRSDAAEDEHDELRLLAVAAELGNVGQGLKWVLDGEEATTQ